ncbi:MAG: Rieske 2Fe-2S domain-containing protein [Candidatus Rokuibacteriota bacterium]|nr:MAG: Rieske 2Fe-2S domain-containing protein [Candidatus Rokubacteria bacterium]
MVFVPVARASEIPVGQGAFVEHDGLAVAVFNAGGGTFYATGPTCPHEDGPLSEGWLEAGVVVCPWHGFDFDVVTGQCRVDPELAVPVYHTRVRGDVVEVDLPVSSSPQSSP